MLGGNTPDRSNFSFAVPSLDKFSDAEDDKVPGEILFATGDIVLNAGRSAIILEVVNTADRPVQVRNLNISSLFLGIGVNYNPHSLLNFLGNWVLLYFGYTSSPDVGPEEVDKMAKAINILG